MTPNSFDAKATLTVGDREYEIFRLDALQAKYDIARLPFSLKILLENLLRGEGNGSVERADIEALASWDPQAQPSLEIAFSPARVFRFTCSGDTVTPHALARRASAVFRMRPYPQPMSSMRLAVPPPARSRSTSACRACAAS